MCCWYRFRFGGTGLSWGDSIFGSRSFNDMQISPTCRRWHFNPKALKDPSGSQEAQPWPYTKKGCSSLASMSTYENSKVRTSSIIKLKSACLWSVVVIAECDHHAIVARWQNFHNGWVGKLKVRRFFCRRHEVFCSQIFDSSQGPIAQLNQRSPGEVEKRGVVVRRTEARRKFENQLRIWSSFLKAFESFWKTFDFGTQKLLVWSA